MHKLSKEVTTMNLRKKWTFLICIFWLSNSSSLACSVVGHYVRPTNFEMVQLADAIVVARAVKQVGTRNDSVQFRVEEKLKGSPPAELDISRASIGKPTPSDPNDLANPNVEAFQGPCTRMTFAKGSSYVLFLVKDNQGGYQQNDYPFTRVNEDFFGINSLWVRTIKSYLDIQERFQPMEQLVELERVMNQKSKGSSGIDHTQSLDILDHLKSRSPFKPTQYLVTTYEMLERGEAPRFSLRHPSEDQEKSNAQLLTNALFGTESPRVIEREAQMDFVLASIVWGNHPDALTLFDRLIANQSIRPKTLGLALRFFAKHNQFDRTFELIKSRALSFLPLLPASEAQELIQDMREAMWGEAWQAGKERWRQSSQAGAEWPEIALRLYWYQYHTFGPDRVLPFDGELESLQRQIKDYRFRPELTLALAKSFDSDIEAWAINELSNEIQRLAFEKQVEARDAEENLPDPADVPMQALVLGYGEERNSALLRVFCQSKPRRMLLIESLGKWADDLDDAFIRRIAATPELTEEERDMLGMAIAKIFGSRALTADRFSSTMSWLDSGDDWYELLKSALSRDSSGAMPIVCTP